MKVVIHWRYRGLGIPLILGSLLWFQFVCCSGQAQSTHFISTASTTPESQESLEPFPLDDRRPKSEAEALSEVKVSFVGISDASVEIGLEIEPFLPDRAFPTALSLPKSYSPTYLDLRVAARRYPIPNQLRIDHTVKGGIGYDEGYTSLSLFVVPIQLSRLYVYIDGRTHFLNDTSDFSSNLGLGFRFLSKKSWLLGANIYYDYRSSTCSFNNLSFGFDVHKGMFSCSTNAYFAVSPKSRLIHRRRCNYLGGYFLERRSELQMYNYICEAQFGMNLFTAKKLSLYLGVGPYYLCDRSVSKVKENIVGVKAQAVLNILKYLQFEFITTYDEINKKKMQGKFSLMLPFSFFSENIHWDKIFFSPRRQEIIPLYQSNFWRWNY